MLCSWLTVTQPRIDVRARRACLLAANGESCAGAPRLGTTARSRREWYLAAHGVRRDRVHGLAREVVALRERRHDHWRPDVPDRAASRIVSYSLIEGSTPAMAGREFAFCSRTLRWTVSS